MCCHNLWLGELSMFCLHWERTLQVCACFPLVFILCTSADFSLYLFTVKNHSSESSWQISKPRSSLGVPWPKSIKLFPQKLTGHTQSHVIKRWGVGAQRGIKENNCSYRLSVIDVFYHLQSKQLYSVYQICFEKSSRMYRD